MDELLISGIRGMSAGFTLGVLVAIIALLIFIYKKFILPKINKTKDIASAISNHGTEAIKGYMDKHTHTTKTNFSNENDDIFYEYVLEEIEKNDLQKGLWAKSLALSEGNNDKAKSLYMQYRVKAIKEELSRLHIDPSSLSPQRIWHILANGISPEEQASFQEERKDNINVKKQDHSIIIRKLGTVKKCYLSFNEKIMLLIKINLKKDLVVILTIFLAFYSKENFYPLATIFLTLLPALIAFFVYDFKDSTGTIQFDMHIRLLYLMMFVGWFTLLFFEGNLEFLYYLILLCSLILVMIDHIQYLFGNNLYFSEEDF